MVTNTSNSDAWLWLTLPIAICLALVSAVGAFVDDFYRDAPYLVAQAIAQDLVDLFVALPALVVSAVWAKRGSVRARFVWLGVIVYILYSFVIYAFHVKFNSMFLAYVIILGCSLYALIGGLATMDHQRVKARLREGAPLKAFSIFLAIIAVLYYLTWLREAIPASIAGTVPQSVIDNGTPTNSVHVLDLAWVLPALVFTAVTLWRGQPLAYTLTPVIFAFAAIMGLAVSARVITMAQAGFPFQIEGLILFGSLAAINLGLLIWYFSQMHAAKT
jgi:hypothetical protein